MRPACTTPRKAQDVPASGTATGASRPSRLSVSSRSCCRISVGGLEAPNQSGASRYAPPMEWRVRGLTSPRCSSWSPTGAVRPGPSPCHQTANGRGAVFRPVLRQSGATTPCAGAACAILRRPRSSPRSSVPAPWASRCRASSKSLAERWQERMPRRQPAAVLDDGSATFLTRLPKVGRALPPPSRRNAPPRARLGRAGPAKRGVPLPRADERHALRFRGFLMRFSKSCDCRC